MIGYRTLRYFTFVMREKKVQSPAVNIKLFAQIAGTHG